MPRRIAGFFQRLSDQGTVTQRHRPLVIQRVTVIAVGKLAGKAIGGPLGCGPYVW
jgi:hypothetical protein